MSTRHKIALIASHLDMLRAQMDALKCSHEQISYIQAARAQVRPRSDWGFRETANRDFIHAVPQAQNRK